MSIIPPYDFIVSPHFDPKKTAFQKQINANSGAELIKGDSEAEKTGGSRGKDEKGQGK